MLFGQKYGEFAGISIIDWITMSSKYNGRFFNRKNTQCTSLFICFHYHVNESTIQKCDGCKRKSKGMQHVDFNNSVIM